MSAPLEKPATPGDPSSLPMTAVIWSSPISASDVTFSSDPGPTPLPAWLPFLFTGDPDASPQVHIPAAPKCPGFGGLFLAFHRMEPTGFLFLLSFSCICLFRQSPDQDQDANSIISVTCLSKEGRPVWATGLHPWSIRSFQTLRILGQGYVRFSFPLPS